MNQDRQWSYSHIHAEHLPYDSSEFGSFALVKRIISLWLKKYQNTRDRLLNIL